jgi:uncharacterized protein
VWRTDRAVAHEAELLCPGIDDQMSDTELLAFLSVQTDGVILSIKLQPRASKNEIVPHRGIGNELRIRVTAPPVDSAANEALVRLLAEWLDCPRSRVELLRGQTSRHKVIKLHGMSAEAVLAKLR